MKLSKILAISSTLLLTQACDAQTSKVDKTAASTATPPAYVTLNLSEQRLTDDIVNTAGQFSYMKSLFHSAINDYAVRIDGPAEGKPGRLPFELYAGFFGQDNIVYGEYIKWRDQKPKIFIDSVASDLVQPLTLAKRAIILEYEGKFYQIGESRLFPHGKRLAWYEPLPILCEGAFADVCKIEVRAWDDGSDLHEFSIENEENWTNRFHLELKLTLKFAEWKIAVFDGTSGTAK